MITPDQIKDGRPGVFSLGRFQIGDCLREIGWLEFKTNKAPAHLDGLIAFRSDSCERRQNKIATVRPQMDCTLNNAEL